MPRNTEKERVAALRDLGILDSHTEEYFDSITRLAKDVLGTDGAYISLIDSDRQWLKASVGFCAPNDSREESFCTHTIQRSEVMVIEDTHLDLRFSDSKMVTGPANVRFYAGAPLLTREGLAIGALCVVGHQARQLGLAERAKLQGLAALVMSHISLRRAVGHVDAVSGMPNKYQLDVDLGAQGREHAGELRALAYIDMPDAATALEIASVLGVPVYDEMVRGVAQKLKRLFRGRATVYHVTDARFAVLSNDSDTEGFTTYAYGLEEALQETLMDLNVPLNLPSFGGIVVFDLCPKAAEDAPRKASSAVNQALISQQRWTLYDTHADASHQRAFRLLNDVRDGLVNDDFHLVYQPKHSLATGSALSAEALLRWNHPELGFISPAEFIPLVEKTALIHPLTDWVIRTAIRQVAEWHAEGHKIKVAINLSALNFEEPDICERLDAACKVFGLPHRYVEIECTEGVWMESPRILKTLHNIRALGMSLALDDFGTGYSNFAYLQKVPATVVKVDQSLVRNVHSNPRDQRIVRSLIALARELEYEVVAEGVETAETLALIQEWGCDVAQGYHFAKPLAPAAFIEHIKL
jgi:EAL domain-containing protein (putative c-di-GMP-specific phosphodiesterase class I)/GGDEF domain-containing protein